MVSVNKLSRNIVAPSLSVVGLAAICKASYTTLWFLLVFAVMYNYIICVVLGIDNNE